MPKGVKLPPDELATMRRLQSSAYNARPAEHDEPEEDDVPELEDLSKSEAEEESFTSGPIPHGLNFVTLRTVDQYLSLPLNPRANTMVKYSGDLQRGERYVDMDYALYVAVDANFRVNQGIFYDRVCRWAISKVGALRSHMLIALIAPVLSSVRGFSITYSDMNTASRSTHPKNEPPSLHPVGESNEPSHFEGSVLVSDDNSDDFDTEYLPMPDLEEVSGPPLPLWHCGLRGFMIFDNAEAQEVYRRALLAGLAWVDECRMEQITLDQDSLCRMQGRIPRDLTHPAHLGGELSRTILAAIRGVLHRRLDNLNAEDEAVRGEIDDWGLGTSDPALQKTEPPPCAQDVSRKCMRSTVPESAASDCIFTYTPSYTTWTPLQVTSCRSPGLPLSASSVLQNYWMDHNGEAALPRGEMDGKYHCFPPWRPDDAAATRRDVCKIYLATGASLKRNEAGAYNSWNSANTVISGKSSATAPLQTSWRSAVEAWQVGCDHGRHAHPVDPTMWAALDVVSSPNHRPPSSSTMRIAGHTFLVPVMDVALSSGSSSPTTPSLSIPPSSAPPSAPAAPSLMSLPALPVVAAALSSCSNKNRSPHSPGGLPPDARAPNATLFSFRASLPVAAPTWPARARAAGSPCPGSTPAVSLTWPSSLPTPTPSELAGRTPLRLPLSGRQGLPPTATALVLDSYGIRCGDVGIVVGTLQEAMAVYETWELEGGCPRMLTSYSFVEVASFTEGFSLSLGEEEAGQRRRWMESQRIHHVEKVAEEHRRREEYDEAAAVVVAEEARHERRRLAVEEVYRLCAEEELGRLRCRLRWAEAELAGLREEWSRYESLDMEDEEVERLVYGVDTDEVLSELEMRKVSPKWWRHEAKAEGGSWYHKLDSRAHLFT
ncbi:hypothetical protein C8J57DRAFT_1538021 [Mycena rebaudengoi]|nr:hypothetical protein C8J57DRAFT_1538021 [Mycena rebaudengoi]